MKLRAVPTARAATERPLPAAAPGPSRLPRLTGRGLALSAALAILAACGGSGASLSGGPAAGAGGATDADGIAAQARAAPEVSGSRPPSAALKPGLAILIDGARAVKGLPGLARNAVPALAGEYAYLPSGQAAAGTRSDRSESPISIRVWFTKEAVPVLADWRPAPCAALPAGYLAVSAPPADDGSTLWAISGPGGILFMLSPESLGDSCGFASVFAERFAFFLRYAERPEDISFPSVLEPRR